MKYSGIIENDVANGPGIRTSLFVSGCRLHCKNCFNKEAQDFNFGEEFTDEIEDKIINSVDDDYHFGISILGGEPTEPENVKVLINFLKKFKDKYKDRKSVWIFSGRIFEDLMNNESTKELLNLCNVLVDGPFIEEKKDISLAFRGSSNQRIILLKTEEDISKLYGERRI